MQFFNEQGYVDFRRVLELPYPFIIMIGARGGGKTYGALDVCREDGLKFAYFRRTQKQVDIINKPEFSPMRPIARDLGFEFTMKPLAAGISAFVPAEADEDGKMVVTGDPWGITVALSTVSNVRGFDASWIDIMLYDEFIPEKGAERTLKNEADALFNAYETMNRNRELQGRPPMRMVLMSNANDEASPVLVKLGLVKRLERMTAKGSAEYYDKTRGLALLKLPESPIIQAKRDTALYRLTEGSEFADMALHNAFSYEERGAIISRPLGEYRPVCKVGGIVIYRHKSDRRFYVTEHCAGSPPTYGTGDTELQRFRRTFGWLWREHMAENVEFEDYACQIEFVAAIGM